MLFKLVKNVILLSCAAVYHTISILCISISSSRFGVLFYIELFSPEIYLQISAFLFRIAAILSFDMSVFNVCLCPNRAPKYFS